MRRYHDKSWYFDVWNQHQSNYMLTFKHMNLAAISVRSYQLQQSMLLSPAILKDWENYQFGSIEEVKNNEKESQAWSEDGRFGFIDHSAKYDVYTTWSNTTSNLVHFTSGITLIFSYKKIRIHQAYNSSEIVYPNIHSIHYACLRGVKRLFKFPQDSGLQMDIFVSHRHKGIAK